MKQIDNIVIFEATPEHVPEIVNLHKKFMAGDDLKEFQDLYLKNYYENIINSDDILIISMAGDKVIGFCSLVKNQQNVLYNLIRNDFTDFFRIPLKNWLRVFKYIFHKINSEFFGQKWEGIEKTNQYKIELRSIVVDPKYRQFGIATRLLKNCIGIARSKNMLPIIAWVSEKNEPSIRLFRKNGFREIALRKNPSTNTILFLLNS